MKILFVVATEGEISIIRSIDPGSHTVDYLVTGPGMVATTYELTRILQSKKYDIAINCGLAGSFDKSIKIGDVVEVDSDTLSELGAEDDENFLSLAEIGLDGRQTFENRASAIIKHDFKRVKSITVNTVHGKESSIEKVIKKYKPQIETMEGAAFFYVCEKENIPCIQIRAISNYVERRNKNAWNIPLALERLKFEVERFIVTL